MASAETLNPLHTMQWKDPLTIIGTAKNKIDKLQAFYDSLAQEHFGGEGA